MTPNDAILEAVGYHRVWLAERVAHLGLTDAVPRGASDAYAEWAIERVRAERASRQGMTRQPPTVDMGFSGDGPRTSLAQRLAAKRAREGSHA